MNAQITNHSPTFATSPQLDPTDLQGLSNLGFKTIVCNRPDGEAGAEQPSSEQMRAEAMKLGLTFHYLPFSSGNLTPELVQQFAQILHSASGPVLAYCRSGARSTQIWGLANS